MLTLVLVMNLGVPVGALPDDDFPLSWLWSWIPQSAVWAGGDRLSGPEQQRGKAAGDEHYVPTSRTDTNGVVDGPLKKSPAPEPYRVVGRDGKFDPATSKRSAADATATSDLYRNKDGSFTRKIYSDPVNFRDSSGAWQPIDRNVLQGPDKRFRQKADVVDISLGETSADPRLVELRVDARHRLAYGLAGASAGAGVAEQNSVRYDEALPGVDFKVEVTASGPKVSIVLASADVAPYFDLPLDLEGLTPTVEANGSVLLRDEKGGTRITIPAAFMQDSRFDRQTGDFTRSDAVPYQLVDQAGRRTLRITPDAAWLHDPARVFPVVIDPSSFMTTGDTYVYKTDTADHSAENNLPVGTFDGGTHVARSLLHFSGFSTTYSGATLSTVSLAAHLTWTYDCTPRTFLVRPIKTSWEAATVAWPGPTLDPAIGTLTPAPGQACYNDDGDRSLGVWVNVPLTASAIQSWLTGGANHGLALTAQSETTSNQWKRFTSRNYANYKFQPYLLVTYTGPGTPQVDGAYPPSGYNSPTLTPTLIAEARDPDSSATLKYGFAVYTDEGTPVVESGWTTSSSWQVPANKLTPGNSYSWTVSVTDGTSTSSPRWYSLTTLPRQPLTTSSLSQNGGKGFEPSSGNYTATITDLKVPTVGPPLAISRFYNSLDTRRLGFGSGWSSLVDTSVREIDTASIGMGQALAVTYPTGQEVVFQQKTDGSFTGPPGRGSVLKCLNSTGAVVACQVSDYANSYGYQLLEKDGTTYTFAAIGFDGGTIYHPGNRKYVITEIADTAKRKLQFVYTSGRLTQIISASGRSLHLTWNTHRLNPKFYTYTVATVRTDPTDPARPETASVWTYQYSIVQGVVRLAAVCAPTQAAEPECTTYDYAATPGSRYPSVVRDLVPTSYWRLTDESGEVAASSALEQGGVDNGTYQNVTLQQPGPLVASAAKGAGFNGTNSLVALPNTLGNESGYRSVSMWFKTTSTGRVLLSQSTEPLSAGATTNWGYTPTLYVDNSGNLVGQFPTAPTTGAMGSLTSPHSGRCMNVRGSGTADGTRVELYDCNGSAAQQWVYNPSKRISIVIGGVTKCLDVVGASTANGADLQLLACNSTTSQQWTLMPNGHIVGVASGKCIDVQSAATANGTPLQIYPCASWVGPSQVWFGSAHSPINSGINVADDTWHHAVLSASGNSQILYVDGVEAGSKAGLVVGGRQKYQYIGGGFLGGGWPGQSQSVSGTNRGTAGFFNGTIAEVSMFDRPLTLDDAWTLDSARVSEVRPLTKMTKPSGRIMTEVAYDDVTGAVSQVTDEHGGAWKISKPSLEGSYLVYSSAVLGSAPTDYWRFAETDANDAINEVNGATASYGTGVTLGLAAGPFGESGRAASFDGVSGHVKLPASDIPLAGPFSISLWFRADTGKNGTLYSYQNQPLGTTPTSFNPALYIGTDGRLRGKLWTGSSPSPIATPGRVDNGAWHHVLLAAGTNSQTMYLDGQAVGTIAGTIAPNGTAYSYIGAGAATTQYWPGARNDLNGYFTGDIAEVAIYKGRQLNQAHAETQFGARNKAVGTGLIKKFTITDPGDGTETTVSYGLPSNRKVAETNAVGAETVYGFDGAGLLQTVVDPNGNYTESSRDAQGNMGSQTSCQIRSSQTQDCATTYYTYVVNTADDMDPCNNKMATVRDGRSASKTDNTYLTTYTYDSRCNNTVITDPLGRKTVTTFSGDNDTAAVDTGYIPAGLATKIVSASGATQRIRYYAGGDVASVTDPAGMTTTYVYDGMGRVVSKTDNAGTPTAATMTMTYDQQSRLLTQTQPVVENQVTGAAHTPRTEVQYDEDGNTVLQRLVDLTGGDAERKTTSEYDDHGRKTKVVDAKNQATTFTYDSFGNLTSQTRPDGTIMTSTYDAAGQLLETWIQNWLDPEDGVVKPLRTTAKSYDPAGRLAAVTDAMGWQTRYEYYDNNTTRRILRADGDGVNANVYVTEENTYDDAGNLVEQLTENRTVKRAFQVDAASRTVATTLDPNGLNRVTRTQYDADNRSVSTTSTDAANTIWAYSETAYDPMNRVVAETSYHGAPDPAKVPTGRWRLDGTSGTTATDTAGNNPGTVDGTVTWSTDKANANTAGSAVFAGSGVINGATTSLDTSRSFTVATWVKLDASAAAPVVIASQDGTKVSAFTLHHNKATGLWTFAMPRADAQDAGVETASSSATAATGTWTHVAGVYDATAKTMRVYVNGVGATAATRTAVPWHGNGRFVIGGGKDGGTLDGRVDIVARDTATGNLMLHANTGAAPGTAFNASTLLATGFSGMTVNLADLTGDGKADVLARDTAGDVWLYPNTGSGGTASLGTRTKIATGWSAYTWIGTGDTDLDGRQDVLTRDAAGVLSVHRNAGGTGLTTLAKNPVTVGLGWNIMDWIGMGDFTGDGRVDILGRKSADGKLYLYVHNGGTGTSTWLAGTLANSGWANTEISTGDANGDGRVDLVARNSAKTMLFYANTGLSGTAIFAPGVQIGSSAWTTSNLYQTANMNGDPAARWRGSIDEVQTYQRALTDSDISFLSTAAHGTIPAGGVTRTSYAVDPGGLVTSAVNASGGVTDYVYDEAGRMAQTISPTVTAERHGQTPIQARAISTVGYNTFGEAVETSDPYGAVTTTRYDALGRVIETIMPEYTPPGSSTPLVPSATKTYDSGGRLKTATDPLGRTTTYDYDQLGLLTKVTAKNGGISEFTYDRVGNQLSVTDPTGATDEVTYDYLGRTCTTTQIVRQPAPGRSLTTQYRYGVGALACDAAVPANEAGRLSQVITPGNVVTKTEYNALGDVTRSIDGAQQATTHLYDGLGRSYRTTLPDGSYGTVTYDLGGRAVETREYDPAGFELAKVTTRYDRAGQVIGTTDALLHESTFAYDVTGMLVSQTQPVSSGASTTTSFGYDLVGRRTRFTDGRGNAQNPDTSFWTTYNSWGQQESAIEPATTAHPALAQRTFTTVYDKAGRPVTQLSPGGVSTTVEYDELDNITEQSGVAPGTTTAERSFDYDLAGRMTSFSGPNGDTTVDYDDRGLPTTITGAAGDNAFSWTDDGRMASRTDAAGVTSYQYDTAGRLNRVTNPTANLLAVYSYNNLSAVEKITYGGADARHFGYDERHRIKTDELKTSTGASVAKISYGYDKNGNLTSKTTAGFGTTAVTNTYTYDWANRLSTWTPTGSGTVNYQYDASGNRTQAGSATFTYDQRNRLLTSGSTTYAYDERGTLRTTTVGTVAATTTADAYGQIVSQDTAAGLPQTYQYDALGRAVREGHTYAGFDNDLASDDPTPASSGTDKAHYVRDPGGQVLGVHTSNAQRYTWTDLHTDVVGQFQADSTALTNVAGYNPFGKPLTDPVPNLIGRLGYQSEWTDTATGRVNMAARWYNPDTGQFDSRDTASNSPVGASINANRYAYGNANPLIAIDPTGHWPTVSDSGTTTADYKFRDEWRKKEASKKAAEQAWRAKNKPKLKRCNQIGNMTKEYAAMGCDAQARPTCPSGMGAYVTVLEWCTLVVVVQDKCFINGAELSKGDLEKIGADCMDAARIMDANGGKFEGYEDGGDKRDIITATLLVDAVTKAAEVGAERERKRKEAECEASFFCRNAGILGAVAGVVAGVGCGIVLGFAGPAAAACGFVGAFVGSLVTGKLQGQSWDDPALWISAGVAGVAGALGGFVGAKIGGALASKMAGGLIARVGAGAITGGVSGAAEGAVTGALSWGVGCLSGSDCTASGLLSEVGTNTMWGGLMGGVGGAAGGLRRPKNAAADGGGGGCGGGHSFVPSTPVLMADGTTRPIAEVEIGDQVLASDPGTGTTAAKPVTALHVNLDVDMADVTVEDEVTGETEVVNTTSHHPFWNATDERWDDAKDLKPGVRLRDNEGKETQLVVSVRTWTGLREMRDLTVGGIHTYYVLVGGSAILVHNSNVPVPQIGACPRPPVPGAKTSAHVDNVSTLSGWDPNIPAGYLRVSPATVLQLTRQMGAPVTPAGFRDHGVDGQYFASHAERQGAIARPDMPIEVDKDMCDDCIEWFKFLAQHRQVPQRVTDPSGVNIFEIDGTWRQE